MTLARFAVFLALLLAAQFGISKQIEPGEVPELGANEGLALFHININSPVRKIRLDRVGSLFSFPEISDLQPGRYVRLLKLPAGTYTFTKLEERALYWNLEKIQNSTFTVEAGKLNYAGELISVRRVAFRTILIENAGMQAREGLERDYPGIREKYPWRYAGTYPEPFVARLQEGDPYRVGLGEPVIEPAIEDRDAAEIIYRRFTTTAGALSPDGRYVVKGVSEGSNTALILVDLDELKERTVYTGVAPSQVTWIGNDVLVVTARTAGTQSKLMRVASVTDVTELPLGFGWVAGTVPGTSKMILGVPERKPKLKVVDSKGKLDKQSIIKAPALNTGLAQIIDYWIDRDGQVRIVEKERPAEAKTSRFRYLAPETGKWIDFEITQEENITHRIAGFDGNRVLMLSNKNREFVELVEFNPIDGRVGATVFAAPNTDLQMTVWELNHQVRAVRYFHNGRAVERSIHGEDDFLLALEKVLPGRNVLLIDQAENGRRLVLSEGPEDPGTYYIYQPHSKLLDLLTLSAPHLESRPMAPTERFVAKADDGFEIEAFLTHFPSERKLPLLVLPHGGPFEVFDFKHFNKEVQYFARIGFAVLQVNFRGSGGTGSSNIKLGIKQWGGQMVSDIERAVDLALERFPLDEARIAAIGTSYGGYGAVRLAQTNPERYRAAIGICGVYDLPALFTAGLNSRSQRNIDWLKKYLGDPVADSALLIEQSPVFGAEAIKSPILLVHDRGDEIAPFEQSVRMRWAALKAGGDVELITVNDEVHGLAVSSTAIATYPKIAQFLRKHLDLPVGRR